MQSTQYCSAVRSTASAALRAVRRGMELVGISMPCPEPAESINQFNQFTFYVFGTHQGSQQTITGKTVYTKH